MNRRLLGVIGGMGPLASAYFYKRLTELQKVEREQEYIDILLYSKPDIPDRSAFILGRDNASPPEAIIAAGKILEASGAAFIAIPCVTSHIFYDVIQDRLNVPVINMVEETARSAALTGAKKAGLLATDGTVKGRVLQNALKKAGVGTVVLPEKSQQSLMDFIYGTAKMGGALDTEKLKRLAGELYSLQADIIINGCTEISMAGREWHDGKNIDALEVLALASLERMGAAV